MRFAVGRLGPVVLLVLLAIGPLSGCSTGPKLRIVTDPPGARLTVINEATGKRVNVARNQGGISGSSTFRANFGKTGLVTYRITAIPPAEALRTHRETTIFLDRSLFRLQPVGRDNVKEMLLRLDGGRRPPPVNMTVRFKSVRVVFPDDGNGRAGGRPISNEWNDLVSGIRAEVQAGGALQALEQLLRQMEAIRLPDEQYLSEERNDEIVDGRLMRFYDVPLTIRLENLSPINDLSEKITRVSGRRISSSANVPEFTPVSAEINYQTTFVDSRLTITVSGIAPVGARVFVYGTNFDEPLEVRRDGTSTAWSQTVRVQPRQRYIYGFSFEPVGATNLRKAFRIDIFSQKTEEVPVPEFERLRQSQP